MENSEWDVLADGLVVYEAKEICRKLEKVNIRFKLEHVAADNAGVVNPRPNNAAAAITNISNAFQQGGLGVMLRILVVSEDLEAARKVIAEKEWGDGENLKMAEPRPIGRVVVFGILVALITAGLYYAGKDDQTTQHAVAQNAEGNASRLGIPVYTAVPSPRLPKSIEFASTIAQHNRDVEEVCKEASNELPAEYSMVDAAHFSGGWGYLQQDACVINAVTNGLSSAAGVAFEHMFVKRRVWEELSLNQYEGRPDMHCIRFDFLKQSLCTDDAGRYYDVLEYLVTGFGSDDLEFLKKDFDEHNGYEGDEVGRARHEDMAAKRRVGYKATYWFDISSFYGKGK